MVNILYIEDDALLQRAVKRVFEHSFEGGANVDTAMDAETAIRFLEAAMKTFGCFHYDHIVCDYDLLNGSSGAEVLAWIHKQSEWLMANDHGEMKSDKQVLLERFTFLAANLQAKVLHNRFIEKPIRPKMLVAALQTKGPICVTYYAES